MAVIGNIRKRSGLLIVIIGFALAAFVVGDFFKGGGRRSMEVGIVNGNEISYQDFERRFDTYAQNTKMQNQKSALSIEENYRVRLQTWSELVKEIIMEEQFDELGLTVTSDELFELLQGANPHPQIVQNFKNPETNEFDRGFVIEYLSQLDQMPAENRDQWVQFEQYIKKDWQQTKYNNLISKGYYVPKALARMAYDEKNGKAKIKYVARKYSEIADSLITLTDADYKAFVEKNQKSYERDASADIEYVVFNIEPSEADFENTLADMMDMKPEFSETDQFIRYVNANSDNSYDSSWFGEGQLPVQIDSLMFNSEVGTVYGPYLNNKIYRLARLIAVDYRYDSLKASHVLVAYQGATRANPEIIRSREEARQIADSLYQIIRRNPSIIQAIAIANSDDGSVSANQGDLGWFVDGRMTGPFNEAVMKNEVGDIVLVETQFGFHIIEVTGKKNRSKKVRVAFLDREVTPSTQTNQKVFAEASKFATDSRSQEAFDQAISDNGMNKRVADDLGEMSNAIAGLSNPREIIRWAFNKETSVGDVSSIFDLENAFVVAVLTKRQEKGLPELEELKTMVETQLINEKKGERLTEEMKTLNTNDLNVYAQNYKASIEEANALTFSARNIPGFGPEDKVLGVCFGLDSNAVSLPTAGAGAAFVVQKVDYTAPAEKDEYPSIVNELEREVQQRATTNYVYNAIKDISDIKDNRVAFF